MVETLPMACGIIADYSFDSRIASWAEDSIDFTYKEDSNVYEVRVFMLGDGLRRVRIKATKIVPCYNLYRILTIFERLAVIFEGAFAKLINVEYFYDDGTSSNLLANLASQNRKNRLAYFESNPLFINECFKLLKLNDCLSSDLFQRWVSLLDFLGNVNQVYLYFTSNIDVPVDIKAAYLIELAEPMAEIVTCRSDNGFAGCKKRMTLKASLAMIIEGYGGDIFVDELLNSDLFYTALVNTRVNIMHVKLNFKEPFLNGSESMLFSAKLSLLYRKIILIVLGIEASCLSINLSRALSVLNSWNGILDNFLHRLGQNSSS